MPRRRKPVPLQTAPELIAQIRDCRQDLIAAFERREMDALSWMSSYRHLGGRLAELSRVDPRALQELMFSEMNSLNALLCFWLGDKVRREFNQGINQGSGLHTAEMPPSLQAIMSQIREMQQHMAEMFAYEAGIARRWSLTDKASHAGGASNTVEPGGEPSTESTKAEDPAPKDLGPVVSAAVRRTR